MNGTDTPRRDRERADRIDVGELILRERLARDNCQWDRMAACYHIHSVVDLSWFKGSGAEFVEQTRRGIESGRTPLNFHFMSPPIVDVNGDRAICEQPCMLRSFSELSGVAVSYEGFVHLFWRAVRDGDRWLLVGLRVAYKVDMFHAREPETPPRLDRGMTEDARDSYRYMIVNLRNSGLVVRDDLNGFDRPETVMMLRTQDFEWLAAA